MSGALDRQLEAYRRIRSELKAEGWALVAREALVKVFEEFDEAAKYADQHFPDEQVLIRHTGEQRPVIPFIVVAR